MVTNTTTRLVELERAAYRASGTVVDACGAVAGAGAAGLLAYTACVCCPGVLAAAVLLTPVAALAIGILYVMTW